MQGARLRFLPPDDPKLRSTIDVIQRDLDREGWLQRFAMNDGFGEPSVAFVICSFWLVEALAATGRLDEARAVFDRVRVTSSPIGILSEDFDPKTGRMWGNFPPNLFPRWIDSCCLCSFAPME